MSPTTESELRKALPRYLVQFFFVWLPLGIGLLHQARMALTTPTGPYDDCIYVILTPPGYLCPFVTLEFTWWFVLLVGVSIVTILIHMGRLANVPHRLTYPLYLYILFLLIFVKPVGSAIPEEPVSEQSSLETSSSLQLAACFQSGQLLSHSGTHPPNEYKSN